jgi:hypothetical protein
MYNAVFLPTLKLRITEILKERNLMIFITMIVKNDKCTVLKFETKFAKKPPNRM